MEATTVYATRSYRNPILFFGILLTALNVLDVYLTHRVSSLGGVEVNPIAELFVFNDFVAYGIKTLIPLAAMSLALVKCKRRSAVALAFLCCYYACIVANNTFFLLKGT